MTLLIGFSVTKPYYVLLYTYTVYSYRTLCLFHYCDLHKDTAGFFLLWDLDIKIENSKEFRYFLLQLYIH